MKIKMKRRLAVFLACFGLMLGGVVATDIGVASAAGTCGSGYSQIDSDTSPTQYGTYLQLQLFWNASLQNNCAIATLVGTYAGTSRASTGIELDRYNAPGSVTTVVDVLSSTGAHQIVPGGFGIQPNIDPRNAGAYHSYSGPVAAHAPTQCVAVYASFRITDGVHGASYDSNLWAEIPLGHGTNC